MTSMDESFTPRKEFLREHRPYFNSFSLFTVSRANLVRLYAFPPPVVTSIRHFLEQISLLIAFRENPNANYCELSLEGKPWASPKSIASETLLLSILSIIYGHGHSYLSTIDYGREQDDRLFMVFQRAIPQLVNSPPGSLRTPSPASPLGVTEHPSTTTLDLHKRTPFALSFPSAAVLRVINPPLHSTPAILQAVRSSWPRGVISEKKVGDGTFEFKLKGYKWYQEDTFATDSLNHILTLLASLDGHSFTLLTSISLTNRSRVKDLWIFTGPAASSTDQFPESPPSSVQGSPRMIGQPFSPEAAFSHQRMATVPTPSTPPAHYTSHPRAATTDASSRPVASSPLAAGSSTSQNALPPGPGLLRKPAPRAQVPVSVMQNEYEESVQEDESDEFPKRPHHPTDLTAQPLREQLPSTVPEGAENMTGVGTGRSPDVFYASSPFFIANASDQHSSEQTSTTAESHNTETTVTPPLDASGRSLSQTSSSRPTSPHEYDEPAPDRLLSPEAFRDSAFSSSGSSPDSAVELPVMWNGKHPDILQANNIVVPPPPQLTTEEQGHPMAPKLQDRTSSGPMLPGAWAPTPVHERSPSLEDATPRPRSLHGDAPPYTTEDGKVTTPVHEVEQRVQSPELTAISSDFDRRSEAGLLMMGPGSDVARKSADVKEGHAPGYVEQENGIVSPGSAEAQKEIAAPENSNGPPTSPHTSGKGWVIVDIEGQPGAPLAESPKATAAADEKDRSAPSAPHAAQSSAAKQIAAVDAIQTLQKKEGSKGSSGAATPGSAFSNSSDNSLHTSDQSPKKGRVRRFFSLGRKSKNERQRTGSSLQSKLTNFGE